MAKVAVKKEEGLGSAMMMPSTIGGAGGAIKLTNTDTRGSTKVEKKKCC